MTTSHPLGIAPLSDLSSAPDEFIRIAHDIGFDFVGLRVVPVTDTEPQYDLSLGSPLHTRVKRALEETGMRVLDAEFLLLDGSDQRASWLQAMERASSFGANTLTVAVADQNTSRVIDSVSQMVEDGKAFGVVPAIEPISYQAVCSLPAAVGIAKASGSYVLPDTLHVSRFSGSPTELREAVDAGLVPMLQLSDCADLPNTDRATLLWESRSKRGLPGLGSGNVAGLLRAVPRTLPISVELPDEERASELGTREWLRLLFATATEFLHNIEQEG
ncbi:sugar phosphate isomerase/epimerase family protein [Corynebacterium hadale]|nr:TIM barrel protein [Corynebacterium hadale]